MFRPRPSSDESSYLLLLIHAVLLDCVTDHVLHQTGAGGRCGGPLWAGRHPHPQPPHPLQGRLVRPANSTVRPTGFTSLSTGFKKIQFIIIFVTKCDPKRTEVFELFLVNSLYINHTIILIPLSYFIYLGDSKSISIVG